MLARWERYDLIAIDEVRYVPMAELGAEFLFQVDRGAGREGGRNPDNQPALFGMDSGDPQRPAMQGVAGSHHRSGTHHRNRER
jgi:hypothetical protein